MPILRGEVYFIDLGPVIGREQAGRRPRRVHRDHEDIVFRADWRDQPPNEEPFVFLCQYFDLVNDVIKFAKVSRVFQFVHGNALDGHLRNDAKRSEADPGCVQKILVRFRDCQEIACSRNELHPDDRRREISQTNSRAMCPRGYRAGNRLLCNGAKVPHR